MIETWCYSKSLKNDKRIDAPTCLWEVEGHYIDLSAFLDHTVIISSDYNYYYTPCANGLNCNYKDEGVFYQAMVTAYDQPGFIQDCVAYLAKWDSTIDPTFSKQSGTGANVFTFKYTNGEASQACTQNRTFIANWICDNSVSVVVNSMIQTSNDYGGCYYTMNITSTYACDQ